MVHLYNSYPNPFDSLSSFVEDMGRLIDSHKLMIDTSLIDHFCRRSETQESYEYYVHFRKEYGKVLTTNIINGRPITVIKLAKPIGNDSLSTNIIELPSPKESSSYSDRWEHIECVIDQSFSDFIADHSSLEREVGDIEGNADIKLALNDQYCIKLHHQPLEKVALIQAESLM